MKEIIKELEKKYYHFAEIIGALKRDLHFYQTPQHDGNAHIEYEGNELLYVHTERGEHYNEKRTKNPDELLYWLLSDLTFVMAADFELKHRKPNEDSRIQMFSKQEELMAKINTDWADDLKKKHKKYLQLK